MVRGILEIIDLIPGFKLGASLGNEEIDMGLYEMAEILDEFGNKYAGFFMRYAAMLREIISNVELSS